MKEDPENNRKKKRIALIVLAAGSVIFFAGLFAYMAYRSTHITTDDAFIEGAIHTVAPRVGGMVTSVSVADNSYVKKGDILVELDRQPFEEQVRAAEARVESARAEREAVKAALVTAVKSLKQAEADVEVAEANHGLVLARFTKARTDFERAERLLAREVISRDRYEHMKTEHDVMKARLLASEKRVEQARTAVETQKAVIEQQESRIAALTERIREAEAGLRLARLNLSYTEIRAPESGYVTRKSVEVGNQVRAGQPLLAIVPLNDIYVIANFKETKVHKIRPGQKVRIRVDAFPGKIFNGKVDSIMAGTGAVFSLFPPENATGNYVKVVQRIPVKIILEPGTDPEHTLRLGMSVVPTVIVTE